MADVSGSVGWFQWATGLLFGAVGGSLLHLYGRQERLAEKVEDRLNRHIETTQGKIDSVEAAFREEVKETSQEILKDVSSLREMMMADRQLAATDRANIAATMLTRPEFDRGLDRIINAFTQHGRIRGGSDG